MPQSFSTLPQWESFLREQVGDGNILLGQLPIGGPPFEIDDMNQLGGFLAEIFATHPFQRALKVIESKYPLSFALYLVLQGIFNYRGGEYWPAPGIQLGITKKYFYSSNCGKTFRRILKTYRLPTFSHIGGLTNLVPILAHGGIPNYSLGDFFKLLKRSLGKEKMLLDAETLIEEWRINPEETFFFIDRPVQRFVLHGGAVAEDFINRCVSLFLAKTDDAIAKLDLPPRVVQEFKIWQEEKGHKPFAKPRGRLERPFIYLDPFGDGVCIALPPQQFPPDITFSRLIWEIKENGNLVNITTNKQHTESGYEFIVSEVLPVSVSSQYSVTLKNELKTIRSWILQGIIEPPILFFDLDTGELLREQMWRQPGERWIAYPNEYELVITKGQKTSELPQQYGAWGKFTIEEWGIHTGGTVILTSPEGKTHKYEIYDDTSLRRPFFEGGTQPLHQGFRNNLPLYSDPPLLVIPFASLPDNLQLSRWRISVKPDGNTYPHQHCSCLLSDLQDWFVVNDTNQLFLDLKSLRLLGSNPCGKFIIDVQGPLGRGRNFRVHFIPHLVVQGQRKLYLSQNDGDAVLHFTCERAAEINCVQEDIELTPVQNDDAFRHYQATIDASILSSKFVYARDDSMRVPFVVKIRRLRWGLWQHSQPNDFSWTTSVLRLFPQSLQNIHETEMFVDLPTLVDDTRLYGGWRLIDPHDEIVAERKPDQKKARQQFTIPLGELMPACRQAQTDGVTLRLQVWIIELENTSKTNDYFIDTLYLLPTLELGETRTEWYFDIPFIHATLSWESQQVSPYMKLLVWPLDQPWKIEPYKLDVSEDSNGFCEWKIPISDIPSLKNYGGDFLGEMVIVDPWSTEESKRPLQQQANTVSFSPQYASKYYRWLEEQFANQETSPEEALTLLAYHYRQQHFNEMHEVNIQISNYAKELKLSIDQLILWADLVKDMGDKAAYKLVQWTLFDEKLLEIIKGEWSNHPRLPQYLAHLSDNLLYSNAYTYLLAAGYQQVHNKCLTGLCRFGEHAGYEELLKDVETGQIVISQAASMFSLSTPTAVPYLLQKRTQNAFNILTVMANTNDIDIEWLQPGFLLESDIGQFEIVRIQSFENGRYQLKKNCLLTDTGKVAMITTNEHESLPATLSLPEKKVAFREDTVYKCSDCGTIYGDYSKLANHHDVIHPMENPAFRPIKGKQIKLKKTIIHLPK